MTKLEKYHVLKPLGDFPWLGCVIVILPSLILVRFWFTIR